MNNIDSLSKKDLAKYVRHLIRGRIVKTEEHGVLVELRIHWADDWSIDLELLQFTPKSEEIKFWFRGKRDYTEFMGDTLSDKLRQLSPVKEFQKELLMIKTLAEKNSDFGDLLEQVFDELNL